MDERGEIMARRQSVPPPQTRLKAAAALVASTIVSVSPAGAATTLFTDATGNHQWGDPANWTAGVPDVSAAASIYKDYGELSADLADDNSGARFRVSYVVGDGNDVMLTVVPEPAIVAVPAMLAAIGRRRRSAVAGEK